MENEIKYREQMSVDATDFTYFQLNIRYFRSAKISLFEVTIRAK